uniref:Uncharacterized protein n=1 Tax=Myotis myotis TaxID=51298 RepID=A0A7J7XHP5_MYOMY|nr:hypothetical protein mMyoMyo1_011755 [Myotis myotis]
MGKGGKRKNGQERGKSSFRSLVSELGLELSLQPAGSQRHPTQAVGSQMMVETKDLAQLRQLNLELLRQLWVGEPLSPLKPCVAQQWPPQTRMTQSDQQSWRHRPKVYPGSTKLPKQRVTFNKESPVPERSWRLRPYLGYDWIAGFLDNSSPISSKPEAFWKLQEFRDTNKECIHNPGTPCRLYRTSWDQWGPKTLADPVQVWVSILDPPHHYRIHRRKSFEASNTVALPRHCLLGWDILPPKSKKSSGRQSLDLWSCVTSKAQHQKLLASSSHLAQPVRSQPPPLSGQNPRRPNPARAPWLKT